MMTFNEYQNFTDETAKYPASKGLYYTALGLAGEAGEYAGKVSKEIRDSSISIDDLVSELGDVLWFVARSARELKVPLSVIVDKNISKLKSRKARGVISGSGDNR